MVVSHTDDLAHIWLKPMSGIPVTQTVWDTFSIQRAPTSDKTPVTEIHCAYICKEPKKHLDWLLALCSSSLSLENCEA